MAENKTTTGGTKIVWCSCVHSYQDKHYGAGMRVANYARTPTTNKADTAAQYVKESIPDNQTLGSGPGVFCVRKPPCGKLRKPLKTNDKKAFDFFFGPRYCQ